MLKTEVLKTIKQITKTHIKWHAYAEALILEIETETDKLPKAYTDCAFGKWYYGDGQYLSFIESFKELEHVHIKLHEIYIDIYKMQITPTKLSLLGFSNKDKKNIILNEYLNKLKRKSDLLIEKFSELVQEITKMDDNTFSDKYGKF